MALTSTDTRPPLPIQLFAPGPTCAAWLALGLLVLAPHLAQPELRRVAGLLPLLYAGALVHAALALRLFAGGAHDRSIPSRLAPAALAALSVGGGMALIARATGEAELVGPAALLSAALTISWSLLIAADAERARGLAGLWITTNGLAAAASRARTEPSRIIASKTHSAPAATIAESHTGVSASQVAPRLSLDANSRKPSAVPPTRLAP